jgi:uncharacterized protein (TIGR03437 family)
MMRFALFLLSTLGIAGDSTTSLGDTYPYMISAITTDSAGNTYVVGSRRIAILTGAFRIGTDGTAAPIGSPATDVFVSKLDPNGQLLFTDTFAGKGVDTGTAIAVDPSGNIYIAGTTTSNDFPLSKALQTQPSPYGSGFIMKLSNDGSTILYSTYFGGVLGSTSITALATDAKGNLYLTGSTTSADFPNVGSALSQGSSGAIYASISAAGDKILYAGANFAGTTPSEGGFSTFGIGVAVDASGNAYFAYNDGASIYIGDGYLTKLDPSGKNIFTANLGSYISAFAGDPAGNVYVGLLRVTGTHGPVQASIAKLDPNASFLWTNPLQSEATSVTSIAVDSAGNVWATGNTSPAFPNLNGWSTGGTEFLARLNSAGSAFTYSALYPSGTIAQSIALDPSGLVHVAGASGFVSAINPNAAPSMKIFDFGNAFGGSATARIAPAEVISIYGPGIGPATAASATPSNGFYPTTFNGVQVQINGMNMPLLYVSANQINAVVPMEVATGAGATVRVVNGTAVSPAYPVWIVPEAPQAFPTVLNHDGTVNSQNNPAHSGSVITFYATGWQSDFSPLADGQVATAAQAIFSGNCCVAIQGVSSAVVLYAGDAPGIVAGVSQFNVQLGTVSVVGQVGFSINFPSAVYQVNQSVWVAP